MGLKCYSPAAFFQTINDKVRADVRIMKEPGRKDIKGQSLEQVAR
jgi:hypothetical protein